MEAFRDLLLITVTNVSTTHGLPLVHTFIRKPLYLDNEHEGRAFYRPSTDAVHMPTRNRFADTPHYYSTLFHELIHSPGHESRLARAFGASFGDDQYSKEESIAET